jgi:hypothetical protein
MRYAKIAMVVGPLALGGALAGCDDGLTDINRNPNQPETVTAQYLFPQGVTASVGLVRGASFDLHFASLWAQHIAKIQYVDEDRYDIRPQTIDTWWTTFYSGPLMDLQKTIEIAGPDAGAAGPAQVMKMWTFAQMTDAWGDIPFSEALQGEGGVTPASYDSQQTVYNGILSQLAAASTPLGSASNSLGSADPDLCRQSGRLAAVRKLAAGSLRHAAEQGGSREGAGRSRRGSERSGVHEQRS